MAKKTNKTDHVLNLLSSGKKASAKEENDAPPVDLRRKAPEPLEEDNLPEPRVSEAEEEQELLEPKLTRNVEEELPEPRVSMSGGEESLPEPRGSAAPAEQPLSEPRIDAEPERMPETKVTVEMAPKAPAVSVVHTSNEENHIADAVRDSLEAEFNEYLREKGEIPAEPEIERLIEWETPKTKEPTEINVFELMRESEEEAEQEERDAAPAEQQESVADDSASAELQQPVVMEAEQEIQGTEHESEAKQEAESVADSEAEPMGSGEEPEQAPMQEKPVAEPDAEPESTGEPNQAADTAIEQAEDAQPEAATEPAAAPAAEPAMPEEKPMEEKDYTMVNVMEYLVRDQAPRYIRQFGHCDCDRCIEDTVALTLTHLPAKYVVVNKNAVSPLLNFYEKKYAGQLIVEITKATMIVNESPNH